MQYIEIVVNIPTEFLQTAEAICSMAVPYGFQTEDYSDVEMLLESMPRELIDDELFEKDRTHAKIHLYISEEINPAEALSYVESRLSEEEIPFEISQGLVDEEDYANAWKKYYKPLRVGKKIMIVPSWEKYTPQKEDIILDLDPGMAFGTGTHETTRLCMEFLEEIVTPQTNILDVGCGSGILAITGIKLGAKSAIGTDIDPVAVKVAKENAELNKVTEKTTFLRSDLTTGVEGTFDVVCANIVADVVIALSSQLIDFLSPNGKCIVSGIIDLRAEEVKNALEKVGLTIIDRKEEGGWVAYLSTWASKENE